MLVKIKVKLNLKYFEFLDFFFSLVRVSRGGRNTCEQLRSLLHVRLLYGILSNVGYKKSGWMISDDCSVNGRNHAQTLEGNCNSHFRILGIELELACSGG